MILYMILIFCITWKILKTLDSKSKAPGPLNNNILTLLFLTPIYTLIGLIKHADD